MLTKHNNMPAWLGQESGDPSIQLRPRLSSSSPQKLHEALQRALLNLQSQPGDRKIAKPWTKTDTALISLARRGSGSTLALTCRTLNTAPAHLGGKATSWSWSLSSGLGLGPGAMGQNFEFTAEAPCRLRPPALSEAPSRCRQLLGQQRRSLPDWLWRCADMHRHLLTLHVNRNGCVADHHRIPI